MGRLAAPAKGQEEGKEEHLHFLHSCSGFKAGFDDEAEEGRAFGKGVKT